MGKKYIISESNLQKVLFKFFDYLFEPHSVTSQYRIGPGFIVDETSKIYRKYNRFNGEIIFYYYSCEYFDTDINNCPLIELEDKYSLILDKNFGSDWEYFLKEWLKLHFNLDVKKIE